MGREQGSVADEQVITFVCQSNCAFSLPQSVTWLSVAPETLTPNSDISVYFCGN